MREQILEKAKYLPFFRLKTIENLTGADNPTIRVTISRMLEKEDLISLKKGYYVTSEYFLRNSRDTGYREFISSVLRSPSYLSLEYILSQHDILTEATYGITSVTIKSTRSYSNKLGEYSYKSIKQELFTGYETVNYGENSYQKATKAKALFDLLYFRANKISADLINKGNLVEDLRLKISTFSTHDNEELNKYAEISKNNKMIQIIENINKHAHN